jgi:hypothetical protein
LHVHSCCRWVDPPGGHQDQRGKQPKQRHSDDKPLNSGSEVVPPKRGRDCAWVRHAVTFQNTRSGCCLIREPIEKVQYQPGACWGIGLVGS